MPVDLPEMLIRIGLAFFSGAILGLERETRGRPAGLRTIVLVCVASSVAAILSDNYYRGSFDGAYQSNSWHPDPARLAAGILTGIGFLGAGVIIQHENWVRGVTTASQIWFVTILGLCYGSGQLILGLIGLIVSLITVYFLHKTEALMRRNAYAFLTVNVTNDGATLKEITSLLTDMETRVKTMEMIRDLQEGRTTLVFSLRYQKVKEDWMPEKVIRAISSLRGITSVHWK